MLYGVILPDREDKGMELEVNNSRGFFSTTAIRSNTYEEMFRSDSSSKLVLLTTSHIEADIFIDLVA